MKKFLLLMICLSFFSFAAIAKERNLQIASYAFDAPDRVARDRQTLARYLTRPYHNDYDKLQAIAYWIASHIAYDGYKYSGGKTSEREIGQVFVRSLQNCLRSLLRRLIYPVLNMSEDMF